MGKFVIKQMSNGQYYFSLKASNGEILVTSEGYTSKSGCMNGIESVKINAVRGNQFIEKTSSNGKYYFNLKSQNGQIIATSQMYNNKNSMLGGIEAVRKYAPNASTE